MATAAAAAAAAVVVVGSPTRLHRLLHLPPLSSSSSLSFFLNPLLISTASAINTNTCSCSPKQIRRQPNFTISSSSGPTSLPCSHLFCHSLPESDIEVGDLGIEENTHLSLESEDDDGNGEDEEEAKLDINQSALMNLDPSTVLKRNRVDPVNLPTLTMKEKKELASYAHSLGKKLKSQLVGKSGVTANVAASFVENLESNELLKVKIHGTCPEELDDAVKQLEKATGSVVVGQIGRTVILYRPSLTKLKAEEKKEQMRKIFLKRKQRHSRPSSMEFQKKGGRPRMFVRDSRGRPARPKV